MDSRQPIERGVPANGEEIRIKRKHKKWTQEALADKAKVNVKTVQRAESGKVIDLNSLTAIVEALENHIPSEQSGYIILIIPSPKENVTPEQLVHIVVEALSAAITARQPITALQIGTGSVKATLEMNVHDIALLQLYLDYAQIRSFPIGNNTYEPYLYIKDHDVPSLITEHQTGIYMDHGIWISLNLIALNEASVSNYISKYETMVAKYIPPESSPTAVLAPT